MNATITLHRSPSAGFDQPFEMLAACHERVERMLGLLQRLQAHLRAVGADADACQAARDVMRYFDLAAPHHHEDEERHVLPRLRDSGDAALVALAERLLDEHRAMAAAWADLRPGLDGLAGGRWPAEAEAAAFDRWAAFDALYRGRLAAEDGTAYPQAARRIAAAELPAIGAEMAARRGASPATAAPAAR